MALPPPPLFCGGFHLWGRIFYYFCTFYIIFGVFISSRHFMCCISPPNWIILLGSLFSACWTFFKGDYPRSCSRSMWAIFKYMLHLISSEGKSCASIRVTNTLLLFKPDILLCFTIFTIVSQLALDIIYSIFVVL